MRLASIAALLVTWTACSTAQQLAVMDFDGTTASVEPNRLLQTSQAAAKLTLQLRSQAGSPIAQMAVEPSGGGCTVNPNRAVSDANGIALFALSKCGDGNVQLAVDAVLGQSRRPLAIEPNFVVYTPSGQSPASFVITGPSFSTVGRTEVYSLQALDGSGKLTDRYEGVTPLSSDANVKFSNTQPYLLAGWAVVQATFVTPGAQTLAAHSAATPSLRGGITVEVHATAP